MPSSTIARRTLAASASLFLLLASVLGLIDSIRAARLFSTRPSVVRRGSTSSRASAGNAASALSTASYGRVATPSAASAPTSAASTLPLPTKSVAPFASSST